MSLDTCNTVLIEICAEAIVLDTPTDLDLTPLKKDQANGEELLQHLATQVEERSGRTLTIRRADVALFDSHVMGFSWYVVRCPIDTPKGVVLELTDEMSLIIIGPYNGGLCLNESAAPAEKVEHYRDFVAQNNAERAKAQQLGREVRDDTQPILDALEEMIASHNKACVSYSEKISLIGSDDPSIQEIALICRRLGIPLREFFADALYQYGK